MSIDCWNLSKNTKSSTFDKTIFDQTAWDENKMPKGYRKEHQ